MSVSCAQFLGGQKVKWPIQSGAYFVSCLLKVLLCWDVTEIRLGLSYCAVCTTSAVGRPADKVSWLHTWRRRVWTVAGYGLLSIHHTWLAHVNCSRNLFGSCPNIIQVQRQAQILLYKKWNALQSNDCSYSWRANVFGRQRHGWPWQLCCDWLEPLTLWRHFFCAGCPSKRNIRR